MSDEQEQTIATDLVVTKYKMAGEMVNKTLQKLVDMCKEGTTVLELCETGDKMLTEETSSVFKKEKDMKKGIAFPTCVSVNNCICHHSPLRSEAAEILKDGDLVKIDLGAHVDGFIAVSAHTIVVGASKENKITGRKADVLAAAYYAAEAALRLVKVGGTNSKVTETITKICETFKCNPIEGMLSHQLKQFVIDGEKSIIQNPSEAQKKEHEKCEFDKHEVYAIDVLVSTGEGKGRELDTRTTVYKRTEGTYQLKMKTSRAFFSEMEKRSCRLPFSLRSFEDETKAKLGVVECVAHRLLDPFQVLYEKDSEFVAQFKYTVLLMPNGNHKITGLIPDIAMYSSEYKIEDEEVKKIINSSFTAKSKSKKKPVKAGVPAVAPDAAGDKTETK